MLRNSKGKVSKTKVGAVILGIAGAIEAAAAVPGISILLVPWMHVVAILIGSIGTAVTGTGVRDAIN